MGMKSTAFSEDLLGLGLVGAISEKLFKMRQSALHKTLVMIHELPEAKDRLEQF